MYPPIQHRLETAEAAPQDGAVSAGTEPLSAYSDVLGHLTDLHRHLGASVKTSMLRDNALDKGMKLPFANSSLREFESGVMISAEEPSENDDYFHRLYHGVLDPLTSGVREVHVAFRSIFAHAAETGVKTVELRTNPMKHNGDNTLDVDRVILGAIHGMEDALATNPDLSAGIIFCLERGWDIERNSILIDKAIRYSQRGVVGVDMAGLGSPNFHVEDYARLFDKAKEAGLGVTFHSGETEATNDMWDVVRFIRPNRIGHGVLAAHDPALLDRLAEEGIVLEVCPGSNLALGNVQDKDTMGSMVRTIVDAQVPIALSTDWPEIIRGNSPREVYEYVRTEGWLSERELVQSALTAQAASFVKGPGLDPYLRVQ